MLLNLEESEKQLLLPAWSDESPLSREAREEFVGVSFPGEHESPLSAAVKNLFLHLPGDICLSFDPGGDRLLGAVQIFL